MIKNSFKSSRDRITSYDTVEDKTKTLMIDNQGFHQQTLETASNNEDKTELRIKLLE